MKKVSNAKDSTAVDIDMSYVPAEWREYAAIQHRANHPLKMSAEYEQAIDACERELAAQRRTSTPGQTHLPSIQLEPVHLAWGIAVLILIGLVLWIGLSVAEAAWSLGQ